MFAPQHDMPVRHELLARLDAARNETDKLFHFVKEDSLYERPIPERHRIVFYVGHLEAFDWNLLGGFIPGLRGFHTAFDRLFAFGIDPVDGGLPADQPEDWPALDEVRKYRERIRETLDGALSNPSFWRATYDGFLPTTFLNVAIEHRLMHAETLAYMFHQLPLEKKIHQGNVPAHTAQPLEFCMTAIPAGAATLGLVAHDGAFGWDNEFEAHRVHVPAFEIDRYKVTNGQYLEFVDAGGYEERSLWDEAGWTWKTKQDLRHPLFWKWRNDRWYSRTMFDELPLPLDWPVFVSHAEAGAYARWAGKQLPTEAQWHRAAYGTPAGEERVYPWGSEAPARTHGYFDFKRWDPVPVNAFARGSSAFGVGGLMGNGWEWTSSLFTPFEGFRPCSFLPGYTANFFDGKHYVLKGGSTRTAECMMRRSFRNWFQPHYPYVYAGFRCVSQ